MQKVIDLVELEDIIPSPTNPRKYFNEAKLQQLADSIKKVDVIQAITLRPFPGKPGKFEIVCGERRYRASKIAGKITIPAEVRELTDDEVMELQFIENIEREDVHPMDEAVTFDAMMRNPKRIWLLEDIAAKINKSESYIIQRMQLLQLIPALQKDFWDDKFLVGHAIQFARLTEQDQKDVSKNVQDGGVYGTVKQCQDYIERNIIRLLSKAPFKMDDDTLMVPNSSTQKKVLKTTPREPARSCVNCLKRSGANTLLFTDIQKDDRCFDKACFADKKEAWLIKEVATTVVDNPNLVLMEGYTYGNDKKTPDEIKVLAKQYGVPLIPYGSDELEHYESRSRAKVKCLVVSGSSMGEYKIMWRKATTKAADVKKLAADGKLSASDIDEQITTIKMRLKRGTELDFEKVQEAIVRDINDNYPSQELLKIPFENDYIVRLMIAYVIYQEVNGYRFTELFKKLNLSPAVLEFGLFHVLTNLTDIQFHTLIKALVMDKYSSTYGDSSHAQLIRILATDLDIEVEKHVALQEVVKNKRVANANKKIAELQALKDDLKEKKKPAAAKKEVAPGAKKIASKAKKAA